MNGFSEAVLVTGGAGFIGSAVVRRLLAEGRQVVNVDALTYSGNLESLPGAEGNAGYTFARADIRDGAAIRELLAVYRPRAVMHLAAESHVDRSIDRPAVFVETNVVGTTVLLQAVHAYWAGLGDDAARFRFLHVSTDEVFGSLGDEGWFDEETRYDPSSPYAASKAASDHFVRAWHRTYGFPAVITNCSNNYGPYQFPEKLIPLMILNALEERELPVYGDGANVRDWLHVDDHVDALLTVVERGRPGETYNIGANCERRNVDLVGEICAILDELQPRDGGRSYRELIRFVADRPGHDRRYAIDPSKLRRELGWSASREFTDGLRETVRWYVGNRRWWERVRSGEYRGERLGLGALV